MLKSLPSFYIALVALLFFPLLFPSFHPIFFAPYLVVTFYKQSRIQVLWKSVGVGLLVDLLSSAPLFGASSLNFAICSLLLYSQKRNFFEEKLSTLPLMTTLFSALSSFIALICYLMFGLDFIFSYRFVFTDLIEMPICDGLYALILFSLPFQLTHKISKLKLYDFIRKRDR